MPLNFTPPPFTLTIGGVNFAPLLGELRLQRPKLDIATPYTWTGSFKLFHPSEPRFLPETLDDLSNPANRWSKGLYPVTFAINGTPLATVRITEYSYDEDEGIAEAQVADLLTFLDSDTPPKSYKDLGLGASANLQSLITSSLTKAGIAAFDINLPNFNFDAAPNKGRGSYIRFLQEYLGERGYWLYCDPTETVKVAKYPLETSNVRFIRSRAQIENYKRQRPPARPADKYVVSGACERKANCTQPKDDVQRQMGEINGVEVVIREQTTTILADGPTEKRSRVRIRQPIGEIFPEAFPNATNLITTDEILETVTWDSQGRKRRVATTSKKPFGIVLPNLFANSTTLMDDAERSLEEWSESLPGRTLVSGGDGVMRSHLKTTWQIYQDPDSNSYSEATKEQFIESWSQGGGDTSVAGEDLARCDRFTYQRFVYQRQTTDSAASIGALKLVDQDKDEDAQPPAFITREAENPTVQVPLRGERSFQPVTFTIFDEQEKPHAAQTLQSNNDCSKLAELLGTVDHRRYHGRLINCPIPAEYLADSSPFPIAHIHDGAWCLEEDTIVLADDGLEVSWIGGLVGKIEPLPHPPPDAPVSQPVSPVRSVIRTGISYGSYSMTSQPFSRVAPIESGIDYGSYVLITQTDQPQVVSTSIDYGSYALITQMNYPQIIESGIDYGSYALITELVELDAIPAGTLALWEANDFSDSISTYDFAPTGSLSISNGRFLWSSPGTGENGFADAMGSENLEPSSSFTIALKATIGANVGSYQSILVKGNEYYDSSLGEVIDYSWRIYFINGSIIAGIYDAAGNFTFTGGAASAGTHRLLIFKWNADTHRVSLRIGANTPTISDTSPSSRKTTAHPIRMGANYSNGSATNHLSVNSQISWIAIIDGLTSDSVDIQLANKP